MRLVVVIHHLFDAKRREIAFRSARIPQCHAERTFFISVKRNRSHIFGMIRDVFRRIIRRAVVPIGIDTKYAEIARMARPHPIIRIPTKLSNRRGRRKHQPDIVIIAIDGQPKLIAAIIGIYNSYQSRIFMSHFFTNGKHHRVDRSGAFRFGHPRFHRAEHPFCNILRPQQETDVKLRIRQLLAAAMRHKTVFQIVVFHRRMLLYTTETAMMIRKYQSVFRHNHPRTKATEADYGILQ